MTSHSRVLEFIQTIRESFIGSEIVYKEGSCYKFYKILKQVFPEAKAYYNSDHVLTEIGGKYYDITGEVKEVNHLPVDDGHYSHEKLDELIFDLKKMKEILRALCENYEALLNLGADHKKHTVDFVSKMGPHSYWLPQFYPGTGIPPDEEKKEAWYVEIYVNKNCVFRESYMLPPDNNPTNAEIEEMLIHRIMEKIFNYGLMAAKRDLEAALKNTFKNA